MREPKWKKWVIETQGPMFNPKLCQEIMDLNKTLEKETGKIEDEKRADDHRKSTISRIDFDKMKPMYDDINIFIQKINRNYFGFEDIQITERAQLAEYSKGGFYGWHTDTALDMDKEPPVRKLSMTLLLNDPSEFEGGDLEIANTVLTPMKQGHAAIFASFLQHRVTPVTKGKRQSFTMWFGGPPLK